MMRIDPKFYRVWVEEGENSAGLICVVYNLDTAKEFVGIEYFELVWTFDNTGITIPSERMATFREELRVLHQAASTYRGPRNIDQQHIRANVKEAYGPNVRVNFTEIQPKP